MYWIGRWWAGLPWACVCWQGVACRMSGDNSRASVKGRYYRAVLGGWGSLFVRWGCTPIYITAKEERHLLTHTCTHTHSHSAFCISGVCRKLYTHVAHAVAVNLSVKVMSNPFVSVGVCPVSFHCRGDRLRAGILSAGETQWQVHKRHHIALFISIYSCDVLCVGSKHKKKR